MRMTYIVVTDEEGDQCFRAEHSLDLNMQFSDDATQLDYLRTTISDLNAHVENAIYRYKNSLGIAEKSDQPIHES